MKQIRTQVEETTLGLRPREAPGAPGEARRRRGRHQGRCGHRDRDEGKEGARRRRDARHEGGGRRGHRPRRRRGAHPRRQGARQPEARRRPEGRRRASSARPSRSRSAGSRPTRARKARSSSHEGEGGEGPTRATTPRPTSTRTWSQAGVIDPTKVVRTALQNASSIASLLLTTEARPVAEAPGRCGAEQPVSSSWCRRSSSSAGRWMRWSRSELRSVTTSSPRVRRTPRQRSRDGEARACSDGRHGACDRAVSLPGRRPGRRPVEDERG